MNDGVILRKGAVKVEPGEMNIIPSSMSGKVALVRSTDKVVETLCSLSHGTGRAMSRSDCKKVYGEYNFTDLRKRILVPDRVSDESLRTDIPDAYRGFEECLNLLEEFIDVEDIYDLVGYIGHL